MKAQAFHAHTGLGAEAFAPSKVVALARGEKFLRRSSLLTNDVAQLYGRSLSHDGTMILAQRSLYGVRVLRLQKHNASLL